MQSPETRERYRLQGTRREDVCPESKVQHGEGQDEAIIQDERLLSHAKNLDFI